MMLTRGLECSVVVFPEGEDIDSFLRKEGGNAFEELLQNAVESLKYCIDFLKSASPREAVEWARNFLRKVEIPELFSPYISRLANQLHMSEHVLREGLADWRGQNQPKVTGVRKNSQSRRNMRDRQILMFAVRYPERLRDLQALGADLLLQSPMARNFWKKINEWGNEAHYYLEEETEKNFWSLCRGPLAAPRDNGDKELEFLRNQLNSHYHNTQKSSVFAALSKNSSPGDFDSDLDYLRALQNTLENRHE
jgi:DNA primase